MVNINYNHNNNIYYITETGFVSYEDKVKLIHEAISMFNQKSKIKILHDMRKAKYEISEINEEGVSNLIDIFKNYDTVIKHAAVHENAIGTAISTLFGHSELPSFYTHKIFYSKETALKWLLNN